MAIDPDLIPMFEEYDTKLQVIVNQIVASNSRVVALEGQISAYDQKLAALVARLEKLETAVPPVVTPTPTPVPTPTGTKPVWEQLTRSKITMPKEVRVPPGTKEIYIPVTADHTKRESFYCYVSGLINVSGGGINVGNTTDQKTRFEWDGPVYRWSPGDDLTHYVRVGTRNTSYAAGKTFGVHVRIKGLTDAQKGQQVNIVFDAAAQPQDPPQPQFHRPLRRLNLSQAQRKNQFDPADVKHHDSGFLNGKAVWRSRLSHGYTQDGNQETGLYMNEDKFPGVAQTPISYDDAEKALRLHTLAFPMDNRPEFESRLFRHQAVVFQGQTMDEVCGSAGVWRMVAKIPVRRYSWPAFWLVGRGSTGAKGSWTQWPPEIDILEKFNYSWGAADTRYTTTFAQHYGKAGTNTRVGVFGSEIEVNQWIPGTGPLDEGYHSWACAITYNDTDPLKSEVTFFFDDIEVGCQVLHARHEDMKTKLDLYPIVNVAVKATGSYTPEQYNTDDGRGFTGDMWVKDVAYYPTGFSFD